MQLGSVVRVNLLDARDCLADPFGQPPYRPHAFLGEHVDLPLQLRDQVNLERIECDGGGTENHILGEHEGEDRQQRAALERRLRDCVADETAEWLDLRSDHGDHLALRGAAEVRDGKTQCVAEQLVAQAPQHPLAEPPFVDVDVVFESAVGADQQQKYAAQNHQVLNLIELDIVNDLRKVRSGDGLVDNDLRQFEGCIEEWKGC